MPSTKDRILDQARRLFNEEGLYTVTLRQIAQALDMSQGNLNYHFKTRRDLVEALYQQLVRAIDDEMAAWEAPTSLFQALRQGSYKSMKHFFNYRFLMRDFYKVLREHPKIRTHYQELQAQRKQQFLGLFGMLVQQGMMRSEAFEGEYVRLHQRMNLVGDNWVNAYELLNGEVEDPVAYYSELLFEMMFPYLTDAGREAFWAS